jgi:CBS domain-containing protein
VNSVAPDDRPVMTARLMADFRRTSLPVIDAGAVAGVISRIDLERCWPDLLNPSDKEN